jgi:probable HAF family extracellular repeat protein
MRKQKQPHRSRPLRLEVLEDRCLLSSYTVTDLGFIHEAFALNDVGQVVGYGNAFDGDRGHGYLWDQGVLTDLGDLRGGSVRPFGINNAGQIVGGAPGGAFLWQDGVFGDLGGLQTASGINNASQIVGGGLLWQDGNITNLGDLGGGGTTAQAINDASMVVGFSFPAIGDVTLHAFLWQDGKMTDLGAAPGDRDGTATAINSAGTIVGETGLLNDDAPVPRAFLYDSGTWNTFGPEGSVALGINDAGQAVGFMPAFGGPVRNHAFLYADGTLSDLNSLIPSGSGLFLESAAAINNAGQIVGSAWDSAGRYRHGFLLTPDKGSAPHAGDPSLFLLPAFAHEAARIGSTTKQPPESTLGEPAPVETVAALPASAAALPAMDAFFVSGLRTRVPAPGGAWAVERLGLELSPESPGEAVSVLPMSSQPGPG